MMSSDAVQVLFVNIITVAQDRCLKLITYHNGRFENAAETWSVYRRVSHINTVLLCNISRRRRRKKKKNFGGKPNNRANIMMIFHRSRYVHTHIYTIAQNRQRRRRLENVSRTTTFKHRREYILGSSTRRSQCGTY